MTVLFFVTASVFTSTVLFAFLSISDGFTFHSKLIKIRPPSIFYTHLIDNDNGEVNMDNAKMLSQELNDLQNELYFIQALELRNEAQLGSFVDEKAQWWAQDESDRVMLLKKDYVEIRIQAITDILITLKQ